MATRAFVLCHLDLSPTANAGEFVLRSSAALVQDQVAGSTIITDVFTTFLFSDTISAIAGKVAAAVRAEVASRAGLGAAGANDVIQPTYTKS